MAIDFIQKKDSLLGLENIGYYMKKMLIYNEELKKSSSGVKSEFLIFFHAFLQGRKWPEKHVFYRFLNGEELGRVDIDIVKDFVSDYGIFCEGLCKSKNYVFNIEKAKMLVKSIEAEDSIPEMADLCKKDCVLIKYMLTE